MSKMLLANKIKKKKKILDKIHCSNTMLKKKIINKMCRYNQITKKYNRNTTKKIMKINYWIQPFKILDFILCLGT
jgi:ribosome-binding protein aMBF1 (putative translation factor)